MLSPGDNSFDENRARMKKVNNFNRFKQLKKKISNTVVHPTLFS